MMARRRTRRLSRNSSTSSRKSCRRRPKRRARNWKASRASRRRRRKRSSASTHVQSKARPWAAPFCLGARSVNLRIARTVCAALVAHEDFGNVGVADRLVRRIRQQILFRDVSDVFGFQIFGEQVIKRLILVGTYVGGDRLQPFLGVVEHRIDIENDAAERMHAVLHHLTNLELGFSHLVHSGARELTDRSACPPRDPWRRPVPPGSEEPWPASTWRRPAWQRQFSWRMPLQPDREKTRFWRCRSATDAATRHPRIPSGTRYGTVP